MSLLVKLNIRYILFVAKEAMCLISIFKMTKPCYSFNTLSRSIAENELKKMDPSYGIADLYLNTTIGGIIIEAYRH